MGEKELHGEGIADLLKGMRRRRCHACDGCTRQDCGIATCNVELFKSWVTSTPREILQKTREVRLKKHLDAVSKVGSWGTQLELVAAATLFKVDIYVATDSLVKGECR